MSEQLAYEQEPDPLMDAWDALPRGPAIFIATCEGERPIHGAWVRLDQPERYFHAEVDLLLGEPAESQNARTWLVLDQHHAGDLMVPEQLSLSGLYSLLEARRSPAR